MKTKFFLLMLLCGAPAAGLFIADRAHSGYFEFPPETIYIQHAGFSGVVFTVMVLCIAVFILPFVLHVIKKQKELKLPEGEI